MIDRVTLVVHDPLGFRDFYRDVLGLGLLASDGKKLA